MPLYPYIPYLDPEVDVKEKRSFSSCAIYDEADVVVPKNYVQFLRKKIEDSFQGQLTSKPEDAHKKSKSKRPFVTTSIKELSRSRSLKSKSTNFDRAKATFTSRSLNANLDCQIKEDGGKKEGETELRLKEIERDYQKVMENLGMVERMMACVNERMTLKKSNLKETNEMTTKIKTEDEMLREEIFEIEQELKTFEETQQKSSEGSKSTLQRMNTEENLKYLDELIDSAVTELGRDSYASFDAETADGADSSRDNAISTMSVETEKEEEPLDVARATSSFYYEDFGSAIDSSESLVKETNLEDAVINGEESQRESESKDQKKKDVANEDPMKQVRVQCKSLVDDLIENEQSKTVQKSMSGHFNATLIGSLIARPDSVMLPVSVAEDPVTPDVYRKRALPDLHRRMEDQIRQTDSFDGFLSLMNRNRREAMIRRAERQDFDVRARACCFHKRYPFKVVTSPVPPSIVDTRKDKNNKEKKFVNSLWFSPKEFRLRRDCGVFNRKKMEMYCRSQDKASSSKKEATDGAKIENDSNYSILVRSCTPLGRRPKMPKVAESPFRRIRHCDILDDLTLKDLAPFDAEYAKEDEEPPEDVRHSLLYRLTCGGDKGDADADALMSLVAPTSRRAETRKARVPLKKPRRRPRDVTANSQYLSPKTATQLLMRNIGEIKSKKRKTHVDYGKFKGTGQFQGALKMPELYPSRSNARKLFPYINDPNVRVFQNVTVLPVEVVYDMERKKNEDTSHSSNTGRRKSKNLTIRSSCVRRRSSSVGDYENQIGCCTCKTPVNPNPWKPASRRPGTPKTPSISKLRCDERGDTRERRPKRRAPCLWRLEEGLQKICKETPLSPRQRAAIDRLRNLKLRGSVHKSINEGNIPDVVFPNPKRTDRMEKEIDDVLKMISEQNEIGAENDALPKPEEKSRGKRPKKRSVSRVLKVHSRPSTVEEEEKNFDLKEELLRMNECSATTMDVVEFKENPVEKMEIKGRFSDVAKTKTKVVLKVTTGFDSKEVDFSSKPSILVEAMLWRFQWSTIENIPCEKKKEHPLMKKETKIPPRKKLVRYPRRLYGEEYFVFMKIKETRLNFQRLFDYLDELTGLSEVRKGNSSPYHRLWDPSSLMNIDYGEKMKAITDRPTTSSNPDDSPVSVGTEVQTEEMKCANTKLDFSEVGLVSVSKAERKIKETNTDHPLDLILDAKRDRYEGILKFFYLIFYTLVYFCMNAVNFTC